MIGVALLAPSAFAADYESVPLRDLISHIQTDAEKRGGADGLVLSIDRAARLALPLPGVKKLVLEYETKDNFLIKYTTILPDNAEVNPREFMHVTIPAGSGKMTLDFRATPKWSANSLPFLMLNGTGELTFTSISALASDKGTDFDAEKIGAFFWQPEEVKHTSINFLTAVYWDISQKQFWITTLGRWFIYLALILAILLFGYRNFGAKKEEDSLMLSESTYMPILCAVFILIANIHFMVRFAPLIHGQVFPSSNDKIRLNYQHPEFGHLAAAAHENISPDSTVLVYGQVGDWFSPQTFCFNIAPITCAMTTEQKDVYKGISGLTEIAADDVDVIIFYHSALSLPPGFQKIFELNQYAYIAEKQ